MSRHQGFPLAPVREREGHVSVYEESPGFRLSPRRETMLRMTPLP